MRTKLQAFTDYTNTLLPHETAYLLSIQKMEDPIRLRILEQVHENALKTEDFTPYDESIDKRKYSHLKNWITERLEAADVDQQLDWILTMQKKILTDTITLAEEKQVLQQLKQYGTGSFYFSQFFELLLTYRHFLQIRMRYADYTLVNTFIQIHRANYEKAKSVHAQLHKATNDIIEQYAKSSKESKQWETWLSSVFYDKLVDGHIRYMALVRLGFMAFNYRKTEILVDKYDYMEKLFEQGEMYSKRILLNHYSNRLLLHSRMKEYDQAGYFGRLSIRTKNHDYLYYIVNLAAVLMRQQKYQEAFELLKEAQSDMKASKNFHNKIGFVAFYIRALVKLGLLKNAENYGDTFLRAYRSEIMHYRWHVFFSAYLEALLVHGKSAKVLRVIRKFKLLERDSQYQVKASYLPNIPWYNCLALYKEDSIDSAAVQERLQEYINLVDENDHRANAFKDLYQVTRSLAPELSRKLQFLAI